MSDENFNKIKEKARDLFDRRKEIYCPYFTANVILNSDGFHHLQFSARRERNKNEQRLKFSLFPLALNVIKKSGTIQEYRETLQPFGKRRSDGLAVSKKVIYWGLVAITGENKIKIKVILRKVGDGNITFWSIMPGGKLKNGQRLFSEGIEDN